MRAKKFMKFGNGQGHLAPFAEFVAKESITPEGVESLQRDVQQLQQSLRDMLGSGYGVAVNFSTLHKISVQVSVYGKATATNGIVQNSPNWMHLWAHGVEHDKSVAFESSNVSRVLKFRKIQAKNFSEACDKVLAWFKKVKPTMDGMENGTIDRWTGAKK